MMIMEEFQKVYTVASLYRGIFAKAIQQFYSEDAAPMRISSPPVAVPDTAGNGGGSDCRDLLQAPEINTEVTNDLIDSLVDENSMFNFWETWGQLWVDQ